MDRLEAEETRLDASSCSRLKLLVGKRVSFHVKFRRVTDIAIVRSQAVNRAAERRSTTEKIDERISLQRRKCRLLWNSVSLAGRFEISQFRQRDARQFHNSRKEQPEN